MAYDALVLVSFGGPERPEDVLPFLQNVTRGRGVPPERLAEVAEHYQHFGGVSPINQQCRDLLAAIRADFAANGVDLPVYWGNRNWDPMLADTVAQMRDDGDHAAPSAFVTSAYGGYSSCRQYQEDIAAARAAVGPDAPVIEKLRQFWDHPGFVEPHADAVRAALAQLDPAKRDTTRLVFTAHSVPLSAAATAGPHGGRYTAQLARGRPAGRRRRRARPAVRPGLAEPLRPAAGAVAGTGHQRPPGRPRRAAAPPRVVVSPIGFVSDHLEVVWDLDTEARRRPSSSAWTSSAPRTPGTDPRFVAMVRELVAERTDPVARGCAAGSASCRRGTPARPPAACRTRRP